MLRPLRSDQIRAEDDNRGGGRAETAPGVSLPPIPMMAGAVAEIEGAAKSWGTRAKHSTSEKRKRARGVFIWDLPAGPVYSQVVLETF